MGTQGNDPDSINELAARVRSYVAAHPGAADTIEGIALWWLAGSGRPADLRLLELALEGMVERGDLLGHDLPDGRRLYRRGPAPPRAGRETDAPGG